MIADHFLGVLDRNGFRRVAVDGVDRQPATIAGCSIVFRGYLANRDELATELGLAGPDRFAEDRLAAHAYRRWGPNLQRKLLGEFALAIFDPQSRTALLQHDAIGLAPLFYNEMERETLFATRLIDLIPLIARDQLDDEYFANYLATGYIATERTPFRSIKRLLPGMAVHGSPGDLKQHRFWNLADSDPVRLARQGEYEEQFRALLHSGIAGSVPREGATWVALSGGLDSSTIACALAGSRAGDVGAYSLIMPGYPDGNEERWMTAVVDHCGIAWHPIDIESALPFSELPDGFLGEPSGAVVNAARRRITNRLFTENGVRTVLTGDGGDVVLGTFPGPIPAHLADPLFRGKPIEAISGLRRWAAASSEQRPLAYWLSRAMLRPASDHLRGRQIRTSAALAEPPWIDKGYSARMAASVRDRRRIAPRCRTPGNQQLWDTIWIGALSMSAGAATLERHVTRTPLLYLPLVEFMQSIPAEVKFRPGCDRLLQRRALKGILPELVRRRGWKTVGTWPFVEGLRRSRQWREFLCDGPQIVSMGLTDRDAWRNAVEQAAAGQTFGDRWFLTAVAFEAWLKGVKDFRRSARSNPRTMTEPRSFKPS